MGLNSPTNEAAECFGRGWQKAFKSCLGQGEPASMELKRLTIPSRKSMGILSKSIWSNPSGPLAACEVYRRLMWSHMPLVMVERELGYIKIRKRGKSSKLYLIVDKNMIVWYRRATSYEVKGRLVWYKAHLPPTQDGRGKWKFVRICCKKCNVLLMTGIRGGGKDPISIFFRLKNLSKTSGSDLGQPKSTQQTQFHTHPSFSWEFFRPGLRSEVFFFSLDQGYKSFCQK